MEKKLSEKIYDEIRDDIDAGKLKEMVFISENQLAERFSVSKGPIKEALHRLCEQGYLISYPRKGYMINYFSRDQINQMQIIRRNLEQLSVELAIENATDEEIESLNNYTESQFNSKDPTKFNNTLFHIRLAEISGNEYISEILTPLLYKTSRIMNGEESDLTKHKEIVKALKDRNVENAKHAVVKDITIV